MEPTTIQDDKITSNESSIQPIQPIEKPKNHKTPIIILSIILCISVIAACVFAYLYFSNNSGEGQGEPAGTSQQTTPPTTEPTEETEITDQSLKDDIDEKIAILLDIEDKSPSLVVRGIGQNDESLFHNGNITESSKVISVISNTLELRPLNEEEIASAISQTGLSGESESYFRQNLAKGIDGNVVVEKYKEIFGEEIAKGPIATSCGQYEYDVIHELYYDAGFGCGGTTPYIRLYYKNRYTTDDKHAYVYTSAAFMSRTFETSPAGTTDKLPWHVYCDITDLGPTGVADNAKECATLQTDEEADSFTLNDSNYEQYAQYRYVFDKADNGVYYFSKVEKL